MPVQYVSTPHSYSSAVMAGDFAFLGLHRGHGDTFDAQFEATMKNLAETLSQIGMEIKDIVKVHVWLKNVSDLSQMEKLFRNHFVVGAYPARMTATTEFIDSDWLLMIEGTAYSSGKKP
jgi:2-iminobutanoate/2-iminopropanoate deaminase